jgi:hypothetical protein
MAVKEMYCEEFEILLADYIDGAPGTPSFLAHLESCAACALLTEDAQRAVVFMGIAAEVDPPPALAGKILHATNSGWEFKLRAKGIRGWINRFFAPVLRPRFVMGAMLTMMSITMLSRCAGGPKNTLTAADLDPVRIWTSLDDRTHRIWDRSVKSYESMRLVYEIRTQLSEWTQQQTEADEAAADARVNSRRLEPRSIEHKQEKK